VNGFAWSANVDALLFTFVIIEVSISYGCSLGRFCTFVFRSSSLGLTKGELGRLVVEGTPAVNGGTKVPIYGRVIGEDVETGDTFKSPKGVATCKDCACEDDCEEVELARAIDLPLLKCIHK